MPKVLVTGATGFVGRPTVRRLLADGWAVRASSRRPRSPEDGVESVLVEDQDDRTDWSRALAGVDAVLHLAGRVHVMKDNPTVGELENKRVNEDGTARLAASAAEAGVKRFVFVSTVKVSGERSESGRPLRVEDRATARDPYGRSKAAAEAWVSQIGAATGMATTVVRPPLVYGPGVQGNFRALLRMVDSQLPIPLGAVHNRRSLVYVGNLADFLAVCLRHRSAAGETFFVNDDQDVSTTDLVQRMKSALGSRSWLVPVPVPALRLAAAAVSRSAACGRLVDSLQVDAAGARTRLGWTAPYSLDEGLRSTVDAYRKRH